MILNESNNSSVSESLRPETKLMSFAYLWLWSKRFSWAPGSLGANWAPMGLAPWAWAQPKAQSLMTREGLYI